MTQSEIEKVEYFSGRSGGRTEALIRMAIATKKTCCLMTPTKHRANVLAKSIKKRWKVRAIPKTATHFGQPIFSMLDEDTPRVIPNNTKSFYVEIVP